MIDDLRALAIFARVAQLRSFRAAARDLGLSPSVVSYHVTRLEERLGGPLLYRTTRRLALTPDGARLQEAATEMLRAAERALESVGDGEDLAGELRITVPAFLAHAGFGEIVARFLEIHPRIDLVIHFTEERRMLVGEGLDLAVRIGDLPDSSLRARRVATMRRRLVAAPRYLERHPAVPVQELELIQLASRPPTLGMRRGGDWERVTFRPRVVVSSAAAMRELLRAGVGVAALPEVLIRDELEEGALIDVPPGWELEELGVYLVWPSGTQERALARRLANHLAPRLERLFSPVGSLSPSQRQ